MKKLLLLVMTCVFALNIQSQEKLYLVFEFMKVDNTQENLYGQVEALWERVHEQRVKDGNIMGWDLWSLKPGGEDQGFQYLTVTLFNDPVKMMNGSENMQALFDKVSKTMTEEELAIFDKTAESRDLSVRIYLEMIDGTDGESEMPIGTLAQIDFMKADMMNSGVYEKAENEIFKPMHQKQVDAGDKVSWGLLKQMLPFGSDVYASHLTVNMYTGYEQMLNSNNVVQEELTKEQEEAIVKGLESREYKNVVHATLIRKVR